MKNSCNRKSVFFKTAGLALLCAILGACKANPAPAPVPAPKPADELDAAIRETSNYLNKQLLKGNKLVILNIQSEFPALSEYIIDELIANTVNDRVFSVVDRQQLDAIRAELDFQMSGEVDDTTAQELGRMAGAQVIISGAVSRIGELYRLRVRALSVENAQITGQFNRNIPEGPTVSALVRSQATGYGGNGSSGIARNASPASQPAPASPGTAAPASPASGGKPQPPPAPAVAPAQTAPPTSPSAATASKPAPAPAPARPAAPQTQLFVGETLQGAMDLLDALDWIALNAQSGGNYTIVLGKDYALPPTELNYDKKTVAITLKSIGGNRTVKFEGASPAYSLFIIREGVTFTLEEGVTLQGTKNKAVKRLVEVSGGRFVMNGGVLTGNTSSDKGAGVFVNGGTITMNGGTINGNTVSETFSNGGGVYVEKGTFTMTDGIISGNTVSSHMGGGGGVYMAKGTSFTMSGGTISENTAGNYYGGGGVFVSGGTFIMTGGTISGNTGKSHGGGVYVEKGTFTMSGGTISGNTASSTGGGVLVDYDTTFTKTGGVIYGSNAPEEQANKAKDDSSGHAVYANGKKRNTTARTSTAMDSGKNGPAGGWE